MGLHIFLFFLRIVMGYLMSPHPPSMLKMATVPDMDSLNSQYL